MASFQVNAADPAQVEWATRKATEREARVHELWRWLLTSKMGREFLMTVVFLDLGPLNVIGRGSTDDIVREAALHDVGARWMRDYVWRHRDLYMQMLAEALKRADDERAEATAKAIEFEKQQREGMNDGD